MLYWNIIKMIKDSLEGIRLSVCLGINNAQIVPILFPYCSFQCTCHSQLRYITKFHTCTYTIWQYIIQKSLQLGFTPCLVGLLKVVCSHQDSCCELYYWEDTFRDFVSFQESVLIVCQHNSWCSEAPIFYSPDYASMVCQGLRLTIKKN